MLVLICVRYTQQLTCMMATVHDGMVEQINHTLKSCLCMHATTYGISICAALIITYLMNLHHPFEMDYRTLTEAAFVQPIRSNLSDIHEL